MGAILDAANDAYRDYVTDGVPGSGSHKPSKADIRAVFGDIDYLLTGSLSESALNEHIPLDGASNAATALALGLASRSYVSVPYNALAYQITSALVVPAGKLLEVKGDSVLSFTSPGTIVLGDNASFITRTGGADQDTWVWARNRAGVHATGGDASNLGYSGAAFHFDIPSDTMDVGTDFSRGLNTRLVFGGAAAKGGRVAVIGQVYHQNAATSSTNNQRYYAGVIGDTHAQVTDGGTGTTLATAKGAYFGLAGHVYGSVAGGNHAGLVGAELNVSNITGATQAYVATLTLANSQATRGAVADAFIMISGLDNTAAGFGNHVGNKHGILFTNINGKDPFASDSTLIGWYWTGGGARTVETGIDLSGFAISNNILQGQRLALSESVLTLGNATGSEVEINAANGTANAAIRIKAKGNGDIILETSGSGAVRLPTTYSAGVAATTGNLIVRDATGTAYRIPCWAA